VRHGDPRRVDAAPFEKINLLRSQRATGRVGKDRYTGPLVDDCRGFEHLALRIEHLVVAPADFADHPGSDTTISSTFEHVALHDLGELDYLGLVNERRQMLSVKPARAADDVHARSRRCPRQRVQVVVGVDCRQLADGVDSGRVCQFQLARHLRFVLERFVGIAPYRKVILNHVLVRQRDAQL